MELWRLRYFQAVAEELSFSKAARRLNVAQPALTRAVQHLESEIGVQLMERTRRSVRLTPAGGTLLQETAVLIQREEEAIRRTVRTASGEEGVLRCGYIGPPTQSFFGRVLSEYRKRFPRVSVVLEERTPERVWEMVAKQRLDVGITRPVLAHAALKLQTELLRKEPLWAVVPRQHPLATKHVLGWKDLSKEPLVMLARREGAGLYDTIIQACGKAGFDPIISQTPSLMSTVLTYVEAGAGIGIMSDSVTPVASTELLSIPLEPAKFVELVMVWSHLHETPPVRAFRQIVTEWLQTGKLWKR